MAQELNEHSELLVLPIVSHFAAGSVGSEPESPYCLIPIFAIPDHTPRVSRHA